MVVGDVSHSAGDVDHFAGEVDYEALCRRHDRRPMTAASAHAAALPPDVLPVSRT